MYFLFSAMPDADMQPQPDDRLRPQDNPNFDQSATSTLRESILAAISRNGSLSFPAYLELVLYDPTHGYYARTDSQVGRAGDFYTSVSVGPLFGQLLARRFLKWWEENARPAAWRIIEIGAHDGKLAADVLITLREISPAAWEALEYAIPEPLPRLREAQYDRLHPLARRLNITASFRALSQNPLPGIAFGNEILDAMPFHLVKFCSGHWHELHVGLDSENALTLISFSPDSSITRKLAELGTDFPENYQTELRTNFPALLESLASSLMDGLILFIDYGFAAPEYYDTHRSSGTLRTFSKHQAAEDPLDRPGEIDISAHVDFTDLAHAARSLGYHPTAFTNQGSFLTHLAEELILSGVFDDPKTIAQFQSLTHPAHLGARFHIIEFQKNKATPPQISHRLAL